MLATATKAQTDPITSQEYLLRATGVPREKRDLHPAKTGAKVRARLLVVGGDIRDQQLVSEALRAESTEIVFLDSLDHLKTSLLESAPFDAMLVELFNPVEPFFDLIPVVKEKNPTTEIIFLSLLADEALWIEAIQRGAYDYLPKPLDIRELRRILRNALERNRSS